MWSKGVKKGTFGTRFLIIKKNVHLPTKISWLSVQSCVSTMYVWLSTSLFDTYIVYAVTVKLVGMIPQYHNSIHYIYFSDLFCFYQDVLILLSLNSMFKIVTQTLPRA